MSEGAKVCIVTGSATGVGAACAIQLADRGWRVVVNYTRSEADAKQVVERCRAKGGEAILVRGDVAADADCRHLAQSALDAWGRIDGLINNAGITKFADAADMGALSAEDWQHLYGVNVIGAWQMIRACEPALRAAGRGSVVNISSISATTASGSSVAYVATKAAMNAMSMMLARSLAPAIRINVVAPGVIDTRWHQDRFADDAAYAKFKSNYEAMIPMGKVAAPDDIAEVAVWMLEGAGHVTGEIVMVDGGMHLGSSPLRAAQRKD